MMTAFPPPPDQQVTLANWRTGPFNRWAFHHVREIVPTAEIAHDPAAVRPLQQGAPLDFPALDQQGGTLDLDGFHDATETDGLVVLHRGRLLHESYRNGMGPHDPHIVFSVSKSMLGLLGGVLADQGLVDPQAVCQHYVPELAGTAFAGATVRELLDMRSGVAFIEDYLATEGPIIDYRKATGWNPLEPGETQIGLRAFLTTLTERSGPDGGVFDYKSPCSDLLGWIFERATGTRYSDLFARHIWSRIGAEWPCHISVDPFGAPRAAGGMCFTTRDLARVGDLMARDGAGIVPAAWVEDIATAGDPAAWDAGSFAPDFPGETMHYRSKWYVLRDRGPILMCLGIHGQNLLADRASGLVLARVSSGAAPLDLTGDLLTIRLFEAIRDGLGG